MTIYSFPSINSTAVASLTKESESFSPSLGAVYVTDRYLEKEDVYADFGQDWTEFVAAVAAFNGK